MAYSRRPLIVFLDLNDSPIENAEASTSEPWQSSHALVLSFYVMSIEQTMEAQSNIDANHYTLKSCVETVTAVSNLSRQLQNRTSESLQRPPESADVVRQLTIKSNNEVVYQ
ncbi:hypothetical protein ACSBR1_001444 [Camellia fascicularis]